MTYSHDGDRELYFRFEHSSKWWRLKLVYGFVEGTRTTLLFTDMFVKIESHLLDEYNESRKTNKKLPAVP